MKDVRQELKLVSLSGKSAVVRIIFYSSRVPSCSALSEAAPVNRFTLELKD